MAHIVNQPALKIDTIDIEATRPIPLDQAEPWASFTVNVKWQNGAEVRYALSRPGGMFSTAQLRHTTLAQSYLARHVGGPVAPPNPQQFFLKLPTVDVDQQSEIWKVIQDGFRREHQLRERMPKESAEVVFPPLLSDGEHHEATCAYGARTERYPYVAHAFLKDHISLRSWVNRSRDPLNGLKDAEQWFTLAAELLKALDQLHWERVAHGFLCPDTIMIRRDYLSGGSEPDIRFVNAAEAQRLACFQISQSVRDEHGGYPIRRWYDPKENLFRYDRRLSTERYACYLLDQGSDYYTATDIYSLGITLAYLATGKDDFITPFEYVRECSKVPEWDKMATGWQLVDGHETRLKHDRMQQTLFQKLESAYNARRGPNDTDKDRYEYNLRRAEVILQCVRSRMDRRARGIGHVMTILNLFHPRKDKRSSTGVRDVKLGDELGKMQKMLEVNARHYSDRKIMEAFNEYVMPRLLKEGAYETTPYPIQAVFRERLAAFLERLDSLNRGTLRVTGSRDTLVVSLLAFLDALEPTDTFVALTSPTIWLDENLGPNSRTSTMLQLIRLRGVGMRWVIVLRNTDLYRTDTQRILNFRWKDERDLEKVIGLNTSGAADGFYYCPVPEDQYDRIFRAKKSFLGVSKDQGRSLDSLIAPDFSSRGGRMAALTFWRVPRRGSELLDELQERIAAATHTRYFDRTL